MAPPLTSHPSHPQGRGGTSRLSKSAKVTVVYSRSNKRRSLVNTSPPNSARSLFFLPLFQPPPTSSASVYLFSPVWACAQQENGSVQVVFAAGRCDLVWVIFMCRVLSVARKYELPTANTPRVRLIQWMPGRKPCSYLIHAAMCPSVLNLRATEILLNATTK